MDRVMLDSNVILKHLFGKWNISELLALMEPYYNDIVIPRFCMWSSEMRPVKSRLLSKRSRNLLLNPRTP